MKKVKRKNRRTTSHQKDPFTLEIKKGERFYKLFFFRPNAGSAISFEYRILTKENTSGTLDVISYNFKIVDNIPQKSSLMTTPNVPKDQIDDIVQNVRVKTNTSQEEFEEVDLSNFSTVEEQLEHLTQLDKINKNYIM